MVAAALDARREAIVRFLTLGICLTLAACTSPADRIADALVSYGLPERQARCMGERLQDRLDTTQLRRLDGIARSSRPGSVGALVGHLTRNGDAKLVSEVVRAGLSCAI